MQGLGIGVTRPLCGIQRDGNQNGFYIRTAGLSLKLRPAVLVFYASMNESKRFRVGSRLIPCALPPLCSGLSAYFSGAIRPA